MSNSTCPGCGLSARRVGRRLVCAAPRPCGHGEVAWWKSETTLYPYSYGAARATAADQAEDCPLTGRFAYVPGWDTPDAQYPAPPRRLGRP